MKLLIIRLITTVSFPIITGVALVLILFYKNLWDALNSWEEDSLSWINQTQKQILRNSVFSQQLIEQHSFSQLQLHLVIIKSLINKYYESKIKTNKDSQQLKCSYQELVQKKCPQIIYKLLNQSTFYVDLYFARENFQFDLLTTQQQDFINMNEFISFYGRAAIVASINNDLLKIQTIYNSDTTSILAHIPSRYENFTDSDYEDCLGKNFTEPYDPRCRPWYLYAQQHKGYFFYEPYLDAIENNLVMTLSSQIEYNSLLKLKMTIQFYFTSSITQCFTIHYFMALIQHLGLTLNFKIQQIIVLISNKTA
ncbi:tetratricopeptide repeat protein (macronuclear) [Tetrahymena thermophila SB210]|uniref:Tetratricopeptide repeat protein n=1 Tax=Tetrahymena thermophila (strain SB210) TaxID=312017 RepID=I7MEB5_TETTS|nr:tetratricopeptide repeat protein [Tetrahymena thermophila SB210]EAR96012.3 tetratricopeptide repeat protein [Tetrahymena thermophila SB210]|eukprot:XP_001016257.3 tetratricopeptide repeat protein [Tetrahymena thermophila SB210]